MIYTRLIFPKLEQELKLKEITIITGMRQVGKTTALEHLFSLIPSNNKVILDLENPLNRKLFEEENYDAVWDNLKQFGITPEEKAFLLLDEVQNLPQISRVVKYLYDHYDVKFILTGSSSYYLKNLFPESLAGRKIVLELFPLTFVEFLHFKGVSKEFTDDFDKKAKSKNKISHKRLAPYYSEFLEFGGFPKIVLEQNNERKKILLEEIFTSYFEKDIKNLADFKDISKLRDLILLLIPRIGSRLEIAKLASELSLSRETIYSYLNFLEQTYFIFMISKFSSSFDRQAAGSKKLYLCDGGLANFLGQISEGQVLEQGVFQCLHSFHKLNFFSKEGRGEIDFIVDGKVALEVKVSASRKDAEFLKRRALGLNLSKYYLVTQKLSDQDRVILATDL